MVRFLVLYNKPSDAAAFERHYGDVHIVLARKLPDLRKYTVSRNVAPVRGGDPYYLVAELDWEDMASFQKAFQSPEGRETAQDVTDNLSRWCPDVRSMIYEIEEVL